MLFPVHSPSDLQRDLQRVEQRIAALTAELRRWEGQRDGLLRQLIDLQGAHDQRPVAVR
jgi:hypothetical protein